MFIIDNNGIDTIKTKIINAIVTTTLKGDILDFSIEYHTDIPIDIVRNSKCKSSKGTEMIHINLLENNSIIWEFNNYSLDLLNNDYSEVTKNDNLVFYDKMTFSRKRD